ncbi:MAG TPA: MFS transporter [Candidatus Eisenbacteria bacterium]|jgi:PAT family beta-lactamase induction signal transducer AmpG
MRFPNLLATRNGRLAAFFFLYLTEGIPLGFTATAVATQMRRQGLGPAEIGAFVGSLYLPWAFKWAVGPFVDVFSSERFGRRRVWIVAMQCLMVASLMVALPVHFTTQIKLFTLLILVHNAFGATQDVAIDALAVNTLREDERGLANGLMFGGAYLGQTLGGAGVLFLTPHTGFSNTYFFVAASILAVTLLVALPIREAQGPPRERAEGSALAAAGREIGRFAVDSFRAFVGTRGAFVGLVIALLPAGAYALGLALQSNLAVELGLNDTQVGLLNLWSTVISALGCVAGGWLSDRFGRRRMLALYLVGTALPTLWLAWAMQQWHWIMPVSPQAANRPVPAALLVSTFWWMVQLYSAAQGLMYGTRSALFMDVTTPRVAATQFTAYMALLNFVTSYSATWQGWAVERWGYPLTLAADSVAGLLCIALLPLMSPAAKRGTPPVGAMVPEAIEP